MNFKPYQGNRSKHTSYTTSPDMKETEPQSWNYQADWVVVKTSLRIGFVNSLCNEMSKLYSDPLIFVSPYLSFLQITGNEENKSEVYPV